MGIKGTVRRSQDAHVIHSNVDTDIIVAEEFPFGSTRKPDEMYSVIEHFCLVRPALATGIAADPRVSWQILHIDALILPSDNRVSTDPAKQRSHLAFFTRASISSHHSRWDRSL